jgi:putative membrane protein insertion efficiency factor
LGVIVAKRAALRSLKYSGKNNGFALKLAAQPRTMFPMRFRLFTFALLLGTASPAFAFDPGWEPWPKKAVQHAKADVPSSQTWMFLWSVRFYQLFISPADGGGCTYYPTCSGYSVQSLRKHGPVLGFILTAERVNRNHSNQDGYFPQLKKFGRVYLYDPVENNDFWFDDTRRTGTNIFAHPYEPTEIFWNHY